ncbi:MAG: hypothetical protein HY824_11725 [Acidobacteria bacterium]|nr:hypothetical protein [Acidobacteriota bacterium]
MRRRAVLIALIAAVAAPIAAQAPPGWRVRIDGGGSAAASDAHPALAFTTMGKGFHIAGGPGAIFFDPARAVKGVYAVRATFTLTKPGAAAAHYGLVFGGTDLEGAAPTYVYFTIAQDGTFMIRHRAGNQVDEIDKSLHFTIRKPDAGGKSTNTLEVQVAPTAVSYLINGAVVDATPTRAGTGSYTETEKTNGIAGIRIDDQIDLQVDEFEVIQPFRPPVRGQ